MFSFITKHMAGNATDEELKIWKGMVLRDLDRLAVQQKILDTEIEFRRSIKDAGIPHWLAPKPTNETPGSGLFGI